ncbi:TPA: hypothetical protein G9C53_005024, partial [Salmonella enterica subsp. enterica serovar Typhimurium var. 5-]|nr:hypothetical protein [Salmonella enterica subsp. enterica serovar Typhimurium var. 5-]
MKRTTKRSFSIFMTAIMILGLWLPFVPAQSAFAVDSSSTNETAATASTDRKVRFTYIREDQNFGEWNIWTWNTGVTDGQVDFTSKTGNKAVVDIPVGQDTKQMGFVLRSTYNWDTAQKEFGDR